MTENEKINGWTFEETVKIAENLMEAESNMLKWDILRHLRDFLENYKDELEQYRAIGTVEEFKALKEKAEPKKVLYEHIPKTSFTKEVSHYLCPSCRSIFSFGGKPYCSNCGQKIDWQ